MIVKIRYAGIVEADSTSYTRGWYGTVEDEHPRRFYVRARESEHARLDYFGLYRWTRSIRLTRCTTDEQLMKEIKDKVIELTRDDYAFVASSLREGGA